MRLPTEGIPAKELLAKLEDYGAGDLDWGGGRAFGYVFDPGADALALAKHVYSRFLSPSGLDFSVYPSLLRLENELTAMLADHLHGDQHVVGNFTSGGTESILLAVKAARDYAKAKREIAEGEMVLPETAHAAFHKAASYLGVKVVPTAVDPKTFRADVGAVEAAVTPNTILVVGSAPSYAHGVIDPIERMAAFAASEDIPFHCDACMGGFLLPFYRQLGEEVPPFDFSVPGVTSISVDLHKYAYAPKGASLILYRDRELRKYQMFTCAQWTGYTVINPTVQSTKSGGPLAAAWAMVHYIGEKGYLEMARKKRDATRQMVAGIERIPELYVLVPPDMCLISFASRTVNVFHVVDEMNARGWYIQPQLAVGRSPANIHLSVNVSNVKWVDAFLQDLAECVKRAKSLPDHNIADQALQILQQSGEINDEVISRISALLGFDGKHLPKRMAPINELFNALDPAQREAFLLEFANRIFVQPG